MSVDKDLVLLQQKNQGYEPQQEQILDYAEYLGLQLPADQRFMYLVVQALKAPLPPFWQACETKNHQIVYRNQKTKIVQQEHPLDEIYRQKIALLKRLQQNSKQMKRDMMDSIRQDKQQDRQSSIYGSSHISPNKSSQLINEQFQKRKSSVLNKSQHSPKKQLSKSGKLSKSKENKVTFQQQQNFSQIITEQSQSQSQSSKSTIFAQMNHETSQFVKEYHKQKTQDFINRISKLPNNTDMMLTLDQNWNYQTQNVSNKQIEHYLQLRRMKQQIENKKLLLEKLRSETRMKKQRMLQLQKQLS